MNASKRQQDSSPEEPGGPETNASQAAIELGALREDCLARLKEIAARAQQLSAQAAADWARAVGEAQMGVQMRQQSLFMDYMGKAQEASRSPQGPEAMKALQELSTRCSSDLDVSREDARKSIEQSRDELRSKVDAGIAEANRDWDAACISFVGTMRQRLSELDPASAEPAALAALGQSLAWVASLMRPPAAR